MRKLLFLLIVMFSSLSVFSQELKCNIQVVSQQIQGTNKQVFKTMQTAVYEFVNTRSWTNHIYEQDEKIVCNILINLTSQISSDEFKGTMQVQARRPVFNSSYNSVLLNFKDDDIHFKYSEFQSLDYSESNTPTSLTALLAYYANIIVGLDYDSFAMKGGSPYFTRAEEIVNKMQNSKYVGWKSYESKSNRYWLVENILNNTYSPIRECMYRYHRLGLDKMSDKLISGRSEIAESLKLLQKAHRAKSGSFFLQIFFDAKADEIVNIFSESFNEEKKRVYAILSDVDPANLTKYKKILE